MKLQGVIGATAVLVLIDSGSTHNFISEMLVHDLQIISQLIMPFGVQIGNGDIIRCSRVCKDVSLKLSDLIVTQDFYPFALGGADMVLGIKWLATLNTVQANWKEMSLAFTIDGQDYKLNGLPPDGHQDATFRHLTIEPIEVHTTGPGALFSVNRLEGKSILRAGCIDTNPLLGSGHTGSDQVKLKLEREKQDGGNSIGGKTFKIGGVGE